MILPVTPHSSIEADLPGFSTGRNGSSDEVGALRTKCEHLSLAVTAMSHELRQGLHILLSCLNKCGSPSGQLLREQALVQDAKELVLRLTGELEGLATLAVIAGAQAGAIHREAVAVQPILVETYNQWQSRAHQKGIRLRMVLDDVTVMSNAHWLGIILSNIVGNAVRHTRSGEICIEGRVQPPDLILAVRDSGPGIDEAEMRRAFGAAPPPRPSGHGLGLGLSIVRRAAEALGHGLGIRSTPFKGTSVCLRLPMIPGPHNDAMPSAEHYWDAT